VSISGALNIYPDPFVPSNNATGNTPIYVSSKGDVQIDLDATYHGVEGRDFAVKHTTGSPRITLNGTYRNFSAPLRTQDPTRQINLGVGRGLMLYNCDYALSRDTGADNVRKGVIQYEQLRNSLVTNETNLTGNLLAVNPGEGASLTISSGEIEVTHATHDVVVEGGAADDLVTINGGATADVLVIYASDGATNAVTAKNGTGNLVLGGDRTLDEAGDTLVLRRHADGNWHEIDFYNVT